MSTSRLLPPEASNSSSWSKRLSQRWNSFTHWFDSIERGRPFRSFTAGAKATRLGSYLFSSTASVASATPIGTTDAKSGNSPPSSLAKKPQTAERDSKHEEKHNTSNGQPESDADDQTQPLSMPSSSSSTLAMTLSLSSSAEIETKEEKESNSRKKNHNTSDAKPCNDEMPGPLHKIILDYASFPELQTMTTGNASLFQSIKMIKTKELITAIASGDLITVKAMIDEGPSLLLERLEEKDNITSLSRQKSNNVTPYRTALAVEDTEIAILIKNKMIEQKAGHIADQQYHEQFPKDWEKEEKERWAPVFEKLETLTQAIRHANREEKNIISSGEPHYRSGVRENSTVAIALAEFRSLLDVKLNETVTTGRHCNPNLLLRAYKIYEEHYSDYFGNDWSDPRAMLFWQQVIGTIQRGLPVNYIQAFCDGLYSTERKLRHNTPQGRSLTIELYVPDRRRWEVGAFYPLADSRLGFEWAAGAARWGGGQRSAPAVRDARPGGRGRLEIFRSLCQSKTEGLQRLMPPPNVRKPSTSCAVM